MHLSEWLQSAGRAPKQYIFEVFDILEQHDVDDNVIKFLAEQIVCAHGSPRMILDDCRKLIEDARGAKLYIIEKYVTDQVLADFVEAEKQIIQMYLDNEILPNGDNKTGLITRIGNFGEIVAAQYLIEFEEYRLPIYKLQYREKKNWASKLTDLCVIKLRRAKKPLVCYSEVKTHSSKLDKNLAIEGHESLIRDDALADPEILRFISKRLYDAGKYNEANLISDMKLGRVEYDRKHELYLIHEASEWDEEVLAKLDEHGLNNGLVDFCVRVIIIKNLRTLIDAVYANSWVAVKAMVDG
jgi:hypothetical protein